MALHHGCMERQPRQNVTKGGGHQEQGSMSIMKNAILGGTYEMKHNVPAKRIRRRRRRRRRHRPRRRTSAGKSPYSLSSHANNLCIALHCVAVLCITLQCSALLCIALHCYTVWHCSALLCIALHFFAFFCIALHCVAFLCTTLHCFALQALLGTALHCFAMLCIALPHCSGKRGERENKG